MIRSLSLMALVWLARVLVPAAPAFAEEYWAATYEDARAGFRAAAGRVAAGWTGAEQKTFAVPSAHGEDLTVDSLYLPAQGEKRQLVVLVSGVHGMEGFAGSAIQRMFLAELAGKVDRQTTGYLLVHSMNPYGMKHGRRATEANVNLNRNCSTKPELYQTANAGAAGSITRASHTSAINDKLRIIGISCHIGRSCGEVTIRGTPHALT